MGLSDTKNLGNHMKKTIIAATVAASLAATTGFAGSVKDPVLEKDVVMAEAASSSSGTAFVALLALVLAIPVLGGSETYIVSDARLKTDITRVGATPSGLPLYTFRYKGDKALYQGVMAQDVLQAKPEAVVTGGQGYMAVDYSRIDAEMIRVE